MSALTFFKEKMQGVLDHGRNMCSSCQLDNNSTFLIMAVLVPLAVVYNYIA